MMFLICFIHEIGHLIMAKIYHCDIEQISLNIFGFSIELKNVEYLKLHQQLLVYIAGPLTVFISAVILVLASRFNIINEYQFYKYMDNNIAMCLFNLIPLYPLDGGRILDAFYRKCYPVKECFILKRIWTIVCSIFLCYILISQNQLILLIVLMSMIVMYLITSKYEYSNYLQNRLLLNINFETKVSFENEIYHFNNNYYWEGNQLINEKDYIPRLIIKEEVKTHRKRNRKNIFKIFLK